MHWHLWTMIGLVILNAGWMLFDGSRALIVGDYVTPKTGRHAGQLGPWSKVVEGLGIQPRATVMKWIFVVYGSGYLLTMLAFVFKVPWAWWGVLIAALLGLWYLPFGTLINVLVIVLISLPPLRLAHWTSSAI